MHEETLYTINGGELVALEQSIQLPRGLGSAIAYNLTSFVDQPGLTIGSWDQTMHADRPSVMSFTREGVIVSAIVAHMDGDDTTAAERIAAIHGWLAPMQLRDLSQLFAEPGAFYEGLWDMSPNATIALQERRRYVVITAEKDIDGYAAVAADLGSADIDFVHLDVFTSDSGDDQIIRWSPDRGRPLEAPTKGPDEAAQNGSATADAAADEPEAAAEPADESAPAAPGAEDAADEPPPPTADVEDAVIDVSDGAQPTNGDQPPPPTNAHGAFVPGRTYAIETLPQLFDPDDNALESISDEMFAVPGHLVLVDKLPERRRQPSPFENPGRYRWDADTDQQTTLEGNLTGSEGPRALHLFVESDRQPGLATYVGLLATAADNKAGRYTTSMWFDIEPKVNAPLWQLFRKGRLPELGDAETDLTNA